MAQHKGKSATHKFVILSVKEGQSFGYLRNKRLRIIVHFEDQELTSKHMYMTPAPYFDCYFAWRVENHMLNSLQSCRANIGIEFKISDEGKKEERDMGYVTIGLRQAEYVTSYCHSPRCRSLLLKGGKFGASKPQIFISLIIQAFKPLNTAGEWHFANFDAQETVSDISENVSDSLSNQEDCSSKSQTNIKKAYKSESEDASSVVTVPTSQLSSNSQASEMLHESSSKAASTHLLSADRISEEIGSSECETVSTRAPTTSRKSSTPPTISTHMSSIEEESSRTPELLQKPKELSSTPSPISTHMSCIETLSEPSGHSQKSKSKVGSSGSIPEIYSHSIHYSTSKAVSSTRTISDGVIPEIISYESTAKDACSKQTGASDETHQGIPGRDSQPHKPTSKGTHTKRSGGSSDDVSELYSQTSKLSHESTSKAAHSTLNVASSGDIAATGRTISDADSQASGVLQHSNSKGASSKQTGTSSDDTAALNRMMAEMYSEGSEGTHESTSKGHAASQKTICDSEGSGVLHESTSKSSLSKNSSHKTISDPQLSKVSHKSTSKSALSKSKSSRKTISYSQGLGALHESTSKSALSKSTSRQIISDRDLQVSAMSHESTSKGAVGKQKVVSFRDITTPYQAISNKDSQASEVPRESTSKRAYTKGTGSSDDSITPRTISDRDSGAAHESILKGTRSKETGTSSDDTSGLQHMISELYSQASDTPRIPISASSSNESTRSTTKLTHPQNTKSVVPLDGTTSKKVFDKNIEIAGLLPIAASNSKATVSTYLDTSVGAVEPLPMISTDRTTTASDVLSSRSSESIKSSQSMRNTMDDNVSLSLKPEKGPVDEQSLLLDYSIDETSIRGMNKNEDTSKLNHMYKLELHLKSIEWLKSLRSVKVVIKFYNPHSNCKVTVQELDYSIPNLLTSDIICCMYYMSLPEDLLKVVLYQPPQILFYKMNKKLIAKGTLTKRNLKDQAQINMFDTFIPIKEKCNEIIGEAHVLIKFEDLGIALKYIKFSCLESTIKHRKKPSPDKKTVQNISLQDVVSDFEGLAVIHEKLRQCFKKMDSGFQKLLKVQILENAEHKQDSQNDEKPTSIPRDEAKNRNMPTSQNAKPITSIADCPHKAKIQENLLVDNEPDIKSMTDQTEVWCEFCQQFHIITKTSNYITAIEAADPQRLIHKTLPKKTTPSHHKRDSMQQDSKPGKARSFKQASVQTTKPIIKCKPREMAYIPKPAITVIKYPCQGCEQYLEVGYGQHVWQDEDLTFWCKDCCIRKLQSEVKETMQNCASKVSALKEQITTLEDEFSEYMINSVSREKYEHVSAAQHNLTMLFMHAKHQNEYLHAQYSQAAQKLEELKQAVPQLSPLFDFTKIEHQFHEGKEDMMETCNRVHNLKQEIDEFRYKKSAPQQVEEEPKPKVKASSKSAGKGEVRLSSRKDRCEACRILSEQAKLAETKKRIPIQSKVPQQIKSTNKDNLHKTDEDKEKEKVAVAPSTFCEHELRSRMASVHAKLQNYMEERDELVRVNRYTCNNIVVSYMTTAINKLLVEWTELNNELAKFEK